MDIMVKKRWLSEYAQMEKEANRLEEDRETIQAKMENLVSPVLDGMPKAQGVNYDVSGLMDELIQLNDMLVKWQTDIARRKRAIYAAMHTLKSSNQRLVIGYKYLDGLDWYGVAEKMEYSKKYVQNIHTQAIERIEIHDDATDEKAK